MTMHTLKKTLTASVAMAVTTLALSGAARADEIRAVLGGDLQVLDPISSSSYATRTFGFMVYDTLFARDGEGEIKPQMLDSYTVSDDGLIYTFVLRDGLIWSDETPVTSDDVVASITRWSQRDGLGGQMMAAAESLTALDPLTVELKLAKPFSMVLDALSKEGSPVPFIMPKALADKPVTEANTEVLGSGPYLFIADEFAPGSKAVFKPNPNFVSRDEAPSGMFGDKTAVTPIELVSVSDAASQIAGIQTGELDFLQYPPFDLLPVLRANPDIDVLDPGPNAGNIGLMRFNHLQPPFDNPKVRQAVAYALDRGEIMTGAGVSPEDQDPDCTSFFSCGTPFEAHKGGEQYKVRDLDKAKALLTESGYAGEEMVLLTSDDDLAVNAAQVIKQELGEAGIPVRVDVMDLNTLFERRASKAPVSEGGWSAFISYLSAMDTSSPVAHLYLNNNCNMDYAGWSCDEEMRALQDAFTSETDPAKRQDMVDQINVLAQASLPTLLWGVFSQPVAMRTSLVGFNYKTSTPVFWGATKE
ncbi:ABC transporter substrate-binding protein [Celeribacter persicus]|uniref:Peptide/nickel transport system substrate-binding protein n=1 Tax=Celeribacter persicus TaxID=1651082 RepID=A0A2T5HUP1_9RHOB|nr:ABC transporter substrate-binding protein [Celeribacter persicus]PTQ75302.1 peptide/nickel transport system substrate-binding protein [Celeribacter persicus]